MLPKSKSYFRIAWQSGLAGGLFLGFPAGLLLWLILVQQIIQSAFIDQATTFLQANGFNKIFLLAVCSLVWSFLLGRISDYHPWWKIGLGTFLGIIIGWFSPLSNMDAWFAEGTPIHVVYAVAMCGIVFSATSSVGLAYGFILRNAKVALILALMTGFISVATMLLTIFFFDQFNIRVGSTVYLAMSKVTTTGLMMSAITGGMTLGVGFSWFVQEGKRHFSLP